MMKLLLNANIGVYVGSFIYDRMSTTYRTNVQQCVTTRLTMGVGARLAQTRDAHARVIHPFGRVVNQDVVTCLGGVPCSGLAIACDSRGGGGKRAREIFMLWETLEFGLVLRCDRITK
jgi:hypothetical protein